MYELEHKRPATVVDTRPVLTMTAPYHRKTDLVAAVNVRARRGEIRPLTARPAYIGATGQWEWQVQQIRPPAPAWIKPAIILAIVLATLAALGGLLWWVLATLTAGALGLFLLAVLVAFALLAKSGKRQSVSIVNNNYVRMR